MLAQRKVDGLALRHAARGEPVAQAEDQARDPLVGGAASEIDGEFHRPQLALLPEPRQLLDHVGAGQEARLEVLAVEAAIVDIGDRLHRAVRARSEQQRGGDHVARQQERQDLPAAVGQRDRGRRPAAADERDGLVHVALPEDDAPRRHGVLGQRQQRRQADRTAARRPADPVDRHAAVELRHGRQHGELGGRADLAGRRAASR